MIYIIRGEKSSVINLRQCLFIDIQGVKMQFFFQELTKTIEFTSEEAAQNEFDEIISRMK